MTGILTVLGSVVCLVGLFAVVSPGRLLRAARRITITTPLRLVAAFVRIVLGIVILLVAGSTRFPAALRVIGVLLIAIAAIVLVVGNVRIQWLVDWLLRRGPNAVRVGGIAGLLFGGFLIYAAV